MKTSGAPARFMSQPAAVPTGRKRCVLITGLSWATWFPEHHGLICHTRRGSTSAKVNCLSARRFARRRNGLSPCCIRWIASRRSPFWVFLTGLTPMEPSSDRACIRSRVSGVSMSSRAFGSMLVFIERRYPMRWAVHANGDDGCPRRSTTINGTCPGGKARHTSMDASAGFSTSS